MSGNPAVNRFHENVRSSIGPGMCFDRVLFRGHVVADVFLVGTTRVYSEGQGFFLSDHFALCGLLDLHASHGSTPLFGTANDTSRARRACLARLRDRAALSENVEQGARAHRSNQLGVAAGACGATRARASVAAVAGASQSAKQRSEGVVAQVVCSKRQVLQLSPCRVCKTWEFSHWRACRRQVGKTHGAGSSLLDIRASLASGARVM